MSKSTKLLEGEVLSSRGIVNINEIEQELQNCDSEPQRLCALADYLMGSQSTIDDVKAIISSLF